MGSLPPYHPGYIQQSIHYNQPAYHPNGNRAPSQRRPVEPTMDHERPDVPLSMNDADFDILDWHPAYQSCQRYFLDHAQHEPSTQAVCALINIRLPFQWPNNPITSSSPSQGPATTGSGSNYSGYPRTGSSSYTSPPSRVDGDDDHRPAPAFASPVPYIRRLVVTGFDKPPILHGFFGDAWAKGILPHVECERRNYLFAAKHGGWRSCKRQYDVGSGHAGDETVPFMKPLGEASTEELMAAEKAWSRWLAMEDWMVGPRAPEDEDELQQFRQRHGSRTGQRGGGSGGTRDGGLPDGMPGGA